MIATNKLSFSVHPTLMTEVGVYTIVVTITDTKESVPTSFTLIVTNQAPSVDISTV